MHKTSKIQFRVLAENKGSGILVSRPSSNKSNKDSDKESFDGVLNELRRKIGQKDTEVSTVFLQMMSDPVWLSLISDGLDKGLTTIASVEKGMSLIRHKMKDIQNVFFLERFQDYEALTLSLLDFLKNSSSFSYPKEPFFLKIEKPTPLDLLDPPEGLFLGIIAKEISESSHTNILAKQMGVALIVIEKGWEDLGEEIWVNIDVKKVYLSFSKVEISKDLAKNLTGQSRTKDGSLVSLYLNAAFEKDLDGLKLPFIKGVGLFRTEIAFLNQDVFPSVDQQRVFYESIFKRAGAAPIAFRIMDIGGDKVPAYFASTLEENPLLGWRSIRIGLDKPLMLRRQMRALIRAASGKSLYILFPMITEIAEFYPLCEILEHEIDREKKMGHPLPKEIKKGITIELPSFAWQFEKIIKDVDFFSVGTNDLFQFFFGVDRMNPHLTNRYDVLSPIFLSLLKHISDVSKENQKTITICGEMASNPLEAMVLIGLGFKMLSMSQNSLEKILKMIETLDSKDFRSFLIPLLSLSVHSLRDQVRGYAKRFNVAI